MAPDVEQHPRFVPDKRILSDLQYVRRTANGDLYLAKRYLRQDFPELQHLRSPKPDSQIIAFEAAARVLNHENLISVVEPLPFPSDSHNNKSKSTEFSLVFEFCADGTLKQLLDNPAVVPSKEHGGFLPEGLVWHVALSILRALVFLHEGKREQVVLARDPGDGSLQQTREWYQPDDEWMPIMHRSIRPENIHFQARKGIETYGLCKPGDFGRCLVLGSARKPGQTGNEVLVCLNNPGGIDLPLDEMREVWNVSSPRRIAEKYGRVYTIGSELADLGAILSRMMTGKEIQLGLCFCGCYHVDPDRAKGCGCECPRKDVFLDFFLTGLKYSEGLQKVVVGLIRADRENGQRAWTWYEEAWKSYAAWKTGTADGRAHKDHCDDLAARTAAELSQY